MIEIDTRALPWYEPTFNAEKFRELLVYVARKCEADPTFGPIKLNKIFYYADFAAFRQLGEPITGATYYRLWEGPAPREMVAERRALIAGGDAKIVKEQHFTGVLRRLVIAPGREPDRELFAPGELKIVDQVVAFFWGRSAREVAEYSQRETGYLIVKDGQSIHYESTHLHATPPEQEDEEAVLL